MNRISWLDILKGLGIILVVIGHSITPRSLFAQVIFSFHMPLFFIIAGYLFNFTKYKDKFKSLVVGRTQRLLLPYVATVGLFYFWDMYFWGQLNWPNGNTITTISKTDLLTLIYGTGNVIKQLPALVPVGPMWYLPCLFSALLLFWCILKLTDNRHYVIRLTVVLLTSILGIVIGRYIFLPWSFDIALASQMFLLVGYTFKIKGLGNKPLPIWSSLLLLLVWVFDIYMGGISMNNREYNNFLISYSGAIAGSVLLFQVAHLIAKIPLINTIISFIGKETIVILGFHARPDIPIYKIPAVITFTKNWAGLSLFRLTYPVFFGVIIRLIPGLNWLYYWNEPLVYLRPFRRTNRENPSF